MDKNRSNLGIKRAFLMLFIAVFIFFNGYKLAEYLKENRKQKNYETTDTIVTDPVRDLSVRTKKSVGEDIPKDTTLVKEINELRFDLAFIEKENDSLRAYLKSYWEELQELKRVDQNLYAKISSLSGKVQNNPISIDNPEKKPKLLNEKTEFNSTLKIRNLNVQPLKITNNKEIPTEKANATDKIKICMNLDENVFVLNDIKNIYIRILNPKGKLLNISPVIFESENGNLKFTLKQQLYYKNKEEYTCLYWPKTESLITGKYNVEVYIDRKRSATSKFSLN